MRLGYADAISLKMALAPVLFCIVAMTSNGQDNAAGGNKRVRNVLFTVSIPQVPPQLPLYQLATLPPPSRSANDLATSVEIFLSRPDKPVKLEPLSKAKLFRDNNIHVTERVTGIVEDDHVRAWIDTGKGEAVIYPLLRNLPPLGSGLRPLGPAKYRSLVDAANSILVTRHVIPRDDTDYMVDGPLLLNGACARQAKSAYPECLLKQAHYLAYFFVRRFADDYPVVGPGSRIFVALDDNHHVEGFDLVWRSALKVGQLSGDDEEEIQKEILTQLTTIDKNSNIKVERIELVYYDANLHNLQPVYRFLARIHYDWQSSEDSEGIDDLLIGYVPYSKSQVLDPLPKLGIEKMTSSSAPSAETCQSPGAKVASHSGAMALSLGRYVISGDSWDWVRNANDFLASLRASPTGGSFSNAQYCWAKPEFFTTQMKQYINAMSLALVEAHGNWWKFDTNCQDGKCGSPMNLRDIPSSGYGTSDGGKLRLWILHSCQVVPAPDDTADWSLPWVTVFGGLRNVVGYRTKMSVSDGAEAVYGSSLGHLAPVMSSWLDDVISLNEYSSSVLTYEYTHGVCKPDGRPVAISECDHEDDSLASTSPSESSGCLTVWWFPDR
jgi:hypothetical protein